MSQISNKGEKFDPAAESGRQLYNEYFGGGMNSIVFQEMQRKPRFGLLGMGRYVEAKLFDRSLYATHTDCYAE